jgi:hypothetical protein
MIVRRSVCFASAGIFLGALAWAVHQQTGYILASMVCAERPYAIWATTLLALVIILGGASMSRCVLSKEQRVEASGQSPPRKLLAIVGMMASLLFLFTILLQASALLFLPSCAT